MRFNYPLDNFIVTSPFGNRQSPYPNEEDVIIYHNGIDLRAAEGTNIYSLAKGVVSNIYYTNKGGNQIIIEHDQGYRTGFAHLSDTLINIGDTVNAGQIIGLSGSTGGFTGMAPHLHLTVKKDNEYINPETLNYKSDIPIITILILALLGGSLYWYNK